MPSRAQVSVWDHETPVSADPGWSRDGLWWGHVFLGFSPKVTVVGMPVFWGRSCSPVKLWVPKY